MTNETLVHQGRPRRYLLARPTPPATGIILSLHGSTSTPEGQLRLSAMAGLAEEHGAVVAFPRAAGRAAGASSGTPTATPGSWPPWPPSS